MAINPSLQSQVNALRARIDAIAPTATPEDIAYLAKGIEAVTGQATIFDVISYGDQKQTELEALSVAKQTSLTNLSTDRETSLTNLSTAKETSLTNLSTAKETSLSNLSSTKETSLTTLYNTQISNLSSAGGVNYTALVYTTDTVDLTGITNQDIVLRSTNPVTVTLPAVPLKQYKIYCESPSATILKNDLSGLTYIPNGSMSILNYTGTEWIVSIQKRTMKFPVSTLKYFSTSLSSIYGTKSNYTLKPLGGGRCVELWTETSLVNTSCQSLWARLIDFSGATPVYGTSVKWFDLSTIYNQPGKNCRIYDNSGMDFNVSAEGKGVFVFGYGYDNTNTYSYFSVNLIYCDVTGTTISNVSVSPIVLGWDYDNAIGAAPAQVLTTSASATSAYNPQCINVVSVKVGINYYWAIFWSINYSARWILLTNTYSATAATPKVRYIANDGGVYGNQLNAFNANNLFVHAAGNTLIVNCLNQTSGYGRSLYTCTIADLAASVSWTIRYYQLDYNCNYLVCKNGSIRTFNSEFNSNANGITSYWYNNWNWGCHNILINSSGTVYTNNYDYTNSYNNLIYDGLYGSTGFTHIMELPIDDVTTRFYCRGGLEYNSVNCIEMVQNSNGTVASMYKHTVSTQGNINLVLEPNRYLNTSWEQHPFAQTNTSYTYGYYNHPLMIMTCNGKDVIFSCDRSTVRNVAWYYDNK